MQGVKRAKSLHKSALLDLARHILRFWDDLPTISARRVFAERLLDEPAGGRDDVKPKDVGSSEERKGPFYCRNADSSAASAVHSMRKLKTLLDTGHIEINKVEYLQLQEEFQKQAAAENTGGEGSDSDTSDKPDFVDIDQPVGEQLAEVAKRVPLLTPEQLADIYSQVGLIESFCKAVCDRVNNELNAGHVVPGFKLVTGKQGNRAWSDEEAARALLKDQFRYKDSDVFSMKLISPTQAEKLIKKEKPRRWTKVEAIITRSNGKPTVAPESDPRPALNINPVNDFGDVSDDAIAADLI